jgi:hypothetical protein
MTQNALIPRSYYIHKASYRSSRPQTWRIFVFTTLIFSKVFHISIFTARIHVDLHVYAQIIFRKSEPRHPVLPVHVRVARVVEALLSWLPWLKSL